MISALACDGLKGGAGERTQASIKLTQGELAELEQTSKSQQKALGEWAREVLLREARRGQRDPVFTEIVATRMLLNLVLKHIACGEVMTAEIFSDVLTKSAHVKAQTGARIDGTVRDKRSERELTMAQQWGRRETVIWPPQVPIYTYGTLILAVPIALTLLFGMYIMKPFLARNYTGAFIHSAAGAEFNMDGSYRLIYLGRGKRPPRVALPEDFVPGSMMLPEAKQISVALSPAAKAQGYTTLFRGPARKFADTTIQRWLQSAIFGGDDLLSTYQPALIETGVVVTFMLCFAVPWDVKRGKRMKYGRLSPRTADAHAKGVQQGCEGSRSRPGEFVQRFYREGRGDYILNPFDARSPYWTPSSELRDNGRYRRREIDPAQ